MTDEELLALHKRMTAAVDGSGVPWSQKDYDDLVLGSLTAIPRLIAEKRALEWCRHERDGYCWLCSGDLVVGELKTANELLTAERSRRESAESKVRALVSASEERDARIRELTEPQPETTAPRDGTRILGKRWALNYYESVSFSAGEFRDRFGERVVIDGWIPSPEVTP